MIKTTFAIATFLGLIVGAPLAQAQKKVEPSRTSTRKGSDSKTTTKKASSSHLTPATETEKAQAKKTAATLTPTQRKSLLDLLNKGTADELVALPSVGEKRAGYIAKARPFGEVESLIDVTGVGLSGFSDIVKYLKSPAPKKEPAKVTPKKATPKTAPKATKKSGS